MGNKTGDEYLELTRLYYERCDFHIAIPKALLASEYFFKSKDFEKYLECQKLLLRMYTERKEFDKINEAKEKLQDLVLKEGFEINSSTYYTLGICSFNKGQFDNSLEYFQKALAIALAKDNKKDMCYAITGIGYTYKQLGRYADALKELYNLQVFFEVLDLPELKVSSQILNGVVLQKLERYDQALEIFWNCYNTLKEYNNHYMYIHLLAAMGETYLKAGDLELARVYLQLARKSADPRNLKSLSEAIDQRLEEIGVPSNEEYDLVFDPVKKSVTEKSKGEIDFRNQFILLDLLQLFMQKPGEVYSKENIAEKIWGQDYDPSIHDNKIYVTIKRLRKLIEPDYEKPKYIFRAKNGYFLNKIARVHVEH